MPLKQIEIETDQEQQTENFERITALVFGEVRDRLRRDFFTYLETNDTADKTALGKTVELYDKSSTAVGFLASAASFGVEIGRIIVKATGLPGAAALDLASQILPLIWNTFDTFGGGVVFAKQLRDGERYCALINFLASTQLGATTTLFALNQFYGVSLGALGTVGAVGLGGFGFAACMLAGWIVEARKVSVLTKEIATLEEKEKTLNTAIHELEEAKVDVEDAKALQAHQENLALHQQAVEKLSGYIAQKRKALGQAKTLTAVWKYSFVMMMLVATAAVVTSSVASLGMLPAILLAVGGAAAACANTYRVYKNNNYSFWKRGESSSLLGTGSGLYQVPKSAMQFAFVAR